ncbi:MAG TPA: FAD-binding oxidoreductase [Conexibacter sp.]
MKIDTPAYARTLRSTFAGPVIAPSDPGWDGARQAFNMTVDQRPALIAVARHARDVVAAVRFAAEHGLRVAPQATGHNAGPLGDLSSTLLLKTAAMRGFTVDPVTRTARVQAGVKWGPVCDAASAHGLAPLSGSARDVGVVGYSLGGGMGWLGRKHGLQCNAVTAIELVTAEGRYLRVDQENEPELFWALRGGGGNFGVVTAIEFDLFPLELVYGGALFYPFERAGEVVHWWHDWTQRLPDEVSTTVRLLQLPPLPTIPEPLRGNSFAVVQAAALGSETFGRAMMAPLRALEPTIDTFQMLEPAGLSYLAMDPEEPLPYDGDGRVYGDMPTDGFDRFLAEAGPGSGSPLVSAELRLTGGALERSHDNHGSNSAIIGSYVSFLVGAAPDAQTGTAVRERIDQVHRSLAIYEVGRYLNFAESPTEVERFYGEPRTARLRELRSQWDPQRTLHANHAL